MNRGWLAVVVSLCVLGLAACPSQVAAPCSAEDAVMLAHAAECKWRVDYECADIPDDACPVIKECDDWGAKRCGFATGGTGGAP